MPDPQPVRPRRKDETEYYRRLKRELSDPMMVEIRAGVSEAASVSEALDSINGVDWDRYQRAGLVDDEIAAQSVKLQGYHRDRLIQTFRASLGVDIRGVLAEAEIDSLMSVWREENVRLVRTIPPRLHDKLLERVSTTFAESPFDRQALSRVLAQEFGSSNYNLRRLTRDQTQKQISNLTEARHRQMGISEYRWSTSEDERVRDTHAANNGKVFQWATPPPATGHPGNDVQCRCVARPSSRAGSGRTCGSGHRARRLPLRCTWRR